MSQSNRSSATYFPASSAPNGVIAALWTDLEVDGESSIIAGQHYSPDCFVIVWKNVRYKNHPEWRFTFQIQLWKAPSWNQFYRQSEIRLSYQTISSFNGNYAAGIEDQEGLKGVGGVYGGESASIMAGTTWRFYQVSNHLVLNKLTLEFTDNSTQTKYDIVEDPEYLAGYHLNYGLGSHPSDAGAWLKALGGTYTILMTFGGLIVGQNFLPLTLPVSCILVGMNWISSFAYAQQTDVEPYQVVDGDRSNGLLSAYTLSDVVDASLCCQLKFGLKDSETEGWHCLTVKATAEYFEMDLITGNVINTSTVSSDVYVKTGPDNNNDWSTAGIVYGGCTYPHLYIGCYDNADICKLYLNAGCPIDVWANVTTGAVWYNLSLYNPVQVLKNFSDNNEWFQRVKFTADSTGFWYIKVCAKHPTQGCGEYTLKIESPSGGGGCPFAHVWNGSEYVKDNNLLPASELSLGSDVQDHYKMEQPMIPKYTNRFFSVYSLEIAENEHEHSYFDQVKLQTVDYDPNINVAVSPTGQILTYTAPIPPKIALDTLGTDQSALMSVMDNEYFEAYAGDSLLVSFGELNLTQGAKLVLRADAWKVSIHVQIQAQNSDWNDVASIIPRVNWATDIIDLSPFLPNTTTEVRIRLYFTAHHKIDFLGIDTSPQADITVHDAILIFANHSVQGPVTFRLFETDTIYAELTPGQQIQLFFIATNQLAQENRSFILYSAGHYEKVD